MKKLLLIASLSLSMLSQAQEYSRAKILTDSRGLQTLAELGVAVDHGTVKRETFFISDFSAAEIQLIKNAGFEVEILIPDVKQYYVDRNATQTEPSRNATGCAGQQGNNAFVPEVPANFNLGTMGGFYTYQEFIDEIDAMAAQYPNLITAKAPIGTFLSIENRPIYFMRMSDNPATDESEPEILYTSIHHAREPNSLSEVIFYMWYLLENYDNSEEIQFLLDNTELYFVPMVNPDGYIYNETTDPNGGGMWRKNRRNNGGSYGVDLNRNYSYQWGTTGVSMTPSADTYPGTGAFSEPEIQAMKWFCENRDFAFAFNAHTYADDILHPIGTTVAEFALDHNYFQAFTGHMVQYNGYSNMKSSDLYPASGDSDDYMYKVDTVQKPKIFAMTPEVGSDGDGFWPASADITGICQEMVFPNLILSHLAHKYLVVTDTDPSTVETMTGNFNHSAYRLGQENGAVTVSIEALTGIQSVGSSVSHDLAIMQTANGAISYTLDPAIQYGDQIRYVLNTEYGLWTKRDTIVKTFGSITSQFIDDASTVVNWTGNWSTTTNEYVSPTQSFTDSPTGDYNNNTTRTYTFNQVIDLSHVTEAAVNYYAKWEIESDYDFCQFQVSIDGGTTWIGQCGLYTSIATSSDGVQPVGEPVYQGAQSAWVLEEISLSDYIGETDVRLRFVLKSDGGVRMDGFYFDDFELMYNIDYTGIEETGLSAKSMPNPANTYAQIAFDQPISTGLVSVYSMTGELIHSEKVSDLTNKIVLNTEKWSEGMYTVVVSETAQFISPAKLVVVH
jgi:carboxypeptidase T